MTQQDAQMDLSERPAFVSWWDYGFQALVQAHPSVSTTSVVYCIWKYASTRSQTDLVSMFVWQLATGDINTTKLIPATMKSLVVLMMQLKIT